MTVRKFLLLTLVFSLFFWVYNGTASAKIKLDNQALSDYGINLSEFRISILSYKGDMLVGIERVEDLELRKEGKIYKLHILKVDVKNQIVRSCNSAYVDLNSLEQLVLSDNGDKLLIMGNKGTRFLMLDTISMKLKDIFSCEKGKPGFRGESIGMYFNDAFYVKGYFYDKDQYSEGDYIAKLDPDKTGLAAFEKTFNIGDLMLDLGSVNTFYLLAPDIGFFTVRKLEGEFLVAYYKGKVIELDSGRAITDMAGSPSRVVYSVMRSKTTSETILLDLDTNKTWNFGRSLPYSFIAHNNGKTVVLAEANYSDIKMNFSYAREEDSFKIKPLLENVEPGSFKLSGDGNVFAYLTLKELLIDKI